MGVSGRFSGRTPLEPSSLTHLREGQLSTTGGAISAPTWMRLVEKHHSATSMTLEMYGPTMDGKGEFKMMQIDYTKKN